MSIPEVAEPRSKYCLAVVDEICDRISKGEALAVICRDEHLPSPDAIEDWCASKPEFLARYAAARRDGYDSIAAECLTIADDKTDDPSSRRVRTDVRLKLLSKWDPKRYGDKLDVNATVAGEIRVVIGGDAE